MATLVQRDRGIFLNRTNLILVIAILVMSAAFALVPRLSYDRAPSALSLPEYNDLREKRSIVDFHRIMIGNLEPERDKLALARLVLIDHTAYDVVAERLSREYILFDRACAAYYKVWQELSAQTLGKDMPTSDCSKPTGGITPNNQ